MAIYVDQLTEYNQGWYKGEQAAQANRVGERNNHQWAHMMSDGDDDELHEFARRLGLKRAWFHRGDHYDLTPRKRVMAVKFGAHEVDSHGLMEVIIRRRAYIAALANRPTQDQLL